MTIVGNRTLKAALEDKARRFPARTLLVFEDRRKSPEFLFAWFAAAKTGTVMVPTNPDATADEMEYILNHSEAKVSLVQGSSAAPVLDAAVVGVPDPVRDEAVRALVILREGARAGEADIIAWCRERLAKFKVPEAVEIRTEFPRTSVGKIQKHVLRQEVRARLSEGKA